MSIPSTLRTAFAPLACAALLAFALPAVAQGPPIPGIIGGINQEFNGCPIVGPCTQFPTAAFVSVQSQGFGTALSTYQETLPLNGLLNYVFYYTAEGDFIAGGNYNLTYLDNDQRTASLDQSRQPLKGAASYPNPFPAYLQSTGVKRLNGDQAVQTINPGGGGPLGISGTIKVNERPVRGADVVLRELPNPFGPVADPVVIYSVKTNQNGFYTFYYDPDNVSATTPNERRTGVGFVRPGSYVITVSVSGFPSWTSQTIKYDPETRGGPTATAGPQRDYFVRGALQGGNDRCFGTCFGVPRPGLSPDVLAEGAATVGADAGAEALSLSAPEVFGIEAAYPNPFSDEVTLSYGLRQAGPVDLAVFDLLGRRVLTLYEGDREAGPYTTTARLNGLASGRYLVRLVQGEQVSTQPITLIE